MINFYWLILLFPLTGFLLNTFAGKKIPAKLSGIIGSISVLLAFLTAILIFFEQNHTVFLPRFYTPANWISVSGLTMPFEFLIDPLSITMVLIVTGVGSLIHIYSIGYMKEDENIQRFFAYMNLFTFSMLILVMAANYAIMFIGWEGVGLCSYLLIGFWYKKDENNYAARKAFIMNRIGDLGFLAAMIMLFITFHSLSFDKIFAQANGIQAGTFTITAITMLLLFGASGKSAQIPLFTWLPDAMAGPTPVSALIHAATMVTAGVYMIARSGALFILAPFTMQIIVIIGIATTLLAAMIGIYQNDIKKILAYSTISQLGYMFVALGLGAFSASVFHLTTHAFFKALLFLAAGSIIHALDGELDIRKMGGLKNKLPLTFFTFLAGTLAISGIPPFAGFFSKDQILTEAFQHNPVLWVLALGGALLTCFYMFRMLYLIFYGKSRVETDILSKLHKTPLTMAVPLVFLALLSVFGGFINLPSFMGGQSRLDHFLEPVLVKINPGEISFPPQMEILLGLVTLALLIVVIWFAYKGYVSWHKVPAPDNSARKWPSRLLFKKFYFDEIYDFLFARPFQWFSSILFAFIEKWVIESLVNGIGSLVLYSGRQVRRLQNGNISFYVFIMILSFILIILYNLYFI